MTEKIYRIDLDLHFYIEAENETIAKVKVIQKIKNNMILKKGFQILEEEKSMSELVNLMMKSRTTTLTEKDKLRYEELYKDFLKKNRIVVNDVISRVLYDKP